MTPAEKTRLLAERVMGWRLINGGMCAIVYASDGMIEMTHDLGKTWSPLTNLSHACGVLEAMICKGWTYDAHDILRGHKVKLSKGRMVVSGTGETMQTAICHAALMAHEVKEKEL